MTDYKGTGYDRRSSEACSSLWFHRFGAGYNGNLQDIADCVHVCGWQAQYQVTKYVLIARKVRGMVG